MKKRLDTPEANELRGIRKERVKRVAKVVGGAIAGGAAGSLIGAGLGKMSAAGYERYSKAAKNPGRTISVKGLEKRNTDVGAQVGGMVGAQLGGIGSVKPRTTAQVKSERTRVKTLRPIVRAQRKNKK